MIAYASRTGTRRNLAALREAGWRLMVSARGVLRHEGFRYSLDNGAWTAHQNGEAFDVPAFEKALKLLGGAAEFTVVPDIVAGGAASLEMSLRWLPRVLDQTPVALFPVQDGMTEADVAPLLGERVGIFVGGGTEFKLGTMGAWCALARKVGCWCHVGRVNTVRRIKACHMAGATSFDGSSASRYAVELPKLNNATRQHAFKLWREE